jgi:hypothetical protein
MATLDRDRLIRWAMIFLVGKLVVLGTIAAVLFVVWPRP